MKIPEILGIADYEYNELLLELGCRVAEERYPPETATRIKAGREYWNWVRQQRVITDGDFIMAMQPTPKVWGTRKAFLIYSDMLAMNLKKATFPRRFETMLLTPRERA